MKRFLLSICFVAVFLGATSIVSSAQCSLCKSTAESSLKEGNSTAKGLNTGIMYLLVMPYLLVGGIGYWWYVQRKKEAKETGSEL